MVIKIELNCYSDTAIEALHWNVKALKVKVDDIIK